MTEKIKILFLSANPADTGLLRLGEETREIVEKVEVGLNREAFEVIHHWALRPRDLQLLLLRHMPDIVHFSGHRSLATEVVLEDDTDKSKRVSSDALAELFDVLKDNVRLIFFDACFSKSQAEALSEGIDYIVGTDNGVGDRAAIAFAAAFYRVLAFGRSVRDAFTLGRTELKLMGVSGENKTALFVREGADPDEPFLSAKSPRRTTDAQKLKTALAHLLSGTADDEQKRLLRGELINGRIVLEQTEGAAENETEMSEAVSLIDSSQSIHLEVGPIAYKRVQELLYRQPRGLAPPLPGLIFVGREDSLADVKTLLGVGEATAPENNLTVVRGWPGVGKTTLVSVLARDPEVLETFPDGVLWTSLEQRPELMSKLAGWGRALGTDDLLRSHTVDDAALRLANLLYNKRMLLIVDDVWDASHVIPFLKASAGSKCALLVTTRLTRVAEELTPDEKRIYLLPVLTEDNALTLLRYLAPEAVEQHPDECRELIRDLECLPLALHVAGRLLKAEAKLGLSVVDLIDGIREGARILPEPGPLDRASGVMIPTVTALFQSVTDSLDERTRDCFAFLGLFAPKPATFDLAAMKAVWEVDDPKPIVGELVGQGLLEPIGGGRFQMHALVVQHARSLLT